MKAHCVKCIKCGDIIFSRALHDFRSCGCGYLAVDGGPEYTKVSCKDPVGIETLVVEIPVGKSKLYHDWNFGENNYGILTIRKYNEEEVLCHIRPVKSNTDGRQ